MKICLAIIVLLLYSTANAQPNDMFTARGKEMTVRSDDGNIFKIKLQAIKLPKNYIYTEGWRWGTDESTPKRIIKNIQAWWGSEEIFIPLSVYVDLSNPYDASLRKVEGEIHLVVKGGDAGTAYEALLIFSKGLIRSKKVVNCEFPDEAWEEITYSFNELDN